MRGIGPLVERFFYSIIINRVWQLKRAAVFVDCKNSFDPYMIARICRGCGLDVKKTLQSIRISRPFTAYQLNTLLEDGLKDVLARKPALVIFSGLLELFQSEDVEAEDAGVILTRVLRELKHMAKPFPLLLTHGDLRGKTTLEAVADTVYCFYRLGKEGARVKIRDDSTLEPRVIDLSHRSRAQAVIEDYLEAC
jgi:hypothetical protein